MSADTVRRCPAISPHFSHQWSVTGLTGGEALCPGVALLEDRPGWERHQAAAVLAHIGAPS